MCGTGEIAYTVHKITSSLMKGEQRVVFPICHVNDLFHVARWENIEDLGPNLI